MSTEKIKILDNDEARLKMTVRTGVSADLILNHLKCYPVNID
jgi:hypothetical protein